MGDQSIHTKKKAKAIEEISMATKQKTFSIRTKKSMKLQGLAKIQNTRKCHQVLRLRRDAQKVAMLHTRMWYATFLLTFIHPQRTLMEIRE